LLDILEAIADVDETLLGKTLEQFTADQMLRLATERLLEIVCEASRNLPDSAKKMHLTSTGEKWSISAIGCGTLITQLTSSLSGKSFRSICPH
jgi:hypothetical protein